MYTLKYLKNDYIPTGEITGFPLPIVDKMIEEQVKQGNKADVTVFEKNSNSSTKGGGFAWIKTEDGYEFWEDIIDFRLFHTFFETYPSAKEFSAPVREELNDTEAVNNKTELPLPRVIKVRDSETDKWEKRVVIAFKQNKAICWVNAETIEESEREVQTLHWSYWREVGEDNDEVNEEIEESIESEYEPYDFSGCIGDYTHLLGKRIISKDNKSSEIIGQIDCSDGLSLINGIEVDYYFDEYTFEDGGVVGELILKNKIRKKLNELKTALL